MAKALSAAIDDTDLRQALRVAIKERFDGDTNALWSDLATDPRFAESVGADPQQREEIALQASRIPRLQVAMPVHFPSWRAAKYAPLVAYVPEGGVDDENRQEVSAYDSEGNAVQLGAQTDPERPVLVLSLNERTDENGELIEGPQSNSRSVRAGRLNVEALAPLYQVDMVKVNLINDHEPWFKGNAEISHVAKSRGCGTLYYVDYDWTSLNDNEDWWVGPRNLGDTRCDVVFGWWEDDGGGFDFTFSYGTFSLGIQMDDDDDVIGAKNVLHSYFEGSSEKKQEFSGLDQWTE